MSLSVMTRGRSVWFGFMGCVAALSAGAADLNDALKRIEPVAATAPVPLLDFFRPAYFSSPQLNPSGTRVAAMVSGGFDKNRIMVVDLATNETELLGGIGNMDVVSFRWLDDTRMVFTVSAEKYWGVALCAVEVGGMGRPYPLIQYGRHHLIGVPLDNRLQPFAWVSGEGAGRDGGIVELKTDIRNARLVDLNQVVVPSADYGTVEDQNRRVVLKRFPVPSGGIVASYFTDPEGKLAFAYTAQDGVFTLHHFTGEDWKRTPIDYDRTSVLAAWDTQGTLLVSDLRYDGQPSAVRLMNADSGEVGEEILRDKGYDVTGGAFIDDATRRIVGMQFDRATPASVWFDDGYRALQELFDGYFPKKVVRIVSNNDANNVFVLAVYTDRDPTNYFIVDLTKKSLGPLKSSRPWIDGERMAHVSIVKFKTAEGNRLDAYLTLPKGASKEHPVPLVVLPHGGPWVRDTLGFDGEAQFLASKGYAVLQPNYRGSPGYDWMFPEADQWDFLKMHADVTAATRTILRTGLIDPARVAIMGSSFGAYLALSGAVHEPDLYKCVVGIAGVYDWAEVVADQARDRFTNPEYGRLRLKLGEPEKEAQKFHDISPIHFVANMKAPMFVSHGKDDPVASVLESRRLVDQLQKFGVRHETLFVSREGHGMANLENRVELYERVAAFLAKEL